jgi:hypothetical protein
MHRNFQNIRTKRGIEKRVDCCLWKTAKCQNLCLRQKFVYHNSTTSALHPVVEQWLLEQLLPIGPLVQFFQGSASERVTFMTENKKCHILALSKSCPQFRGNHKEIRFLGNKIQGHSQILAWKSVRNS